MAGPAFRLCVVQKPAGGTDKAESRREPGAWVHAQQVPWTTGLKIAENGCTIVLSHVLASDSVTQNGCHIWRNQMVDADGPWRCVNDWHDSVFALYRARGGWYGGLE